MTSEPRDITLADLVALREKATPGPWFRQGTLINGPDQGGIDIGPLLMDLYSEHDAEFLTAAGSFDYAATAARIEALEAALKDVKDWLVEYYPDTHILDMVVAALGDSR